MRRNSPLLFAALSAALTALIACMSGEIAHHYRERGCLAGVSQVGPSAYKFDLIDEIGVTEVWTENQRRYEHLPPCS